MNQKLLSTHSCRTCLYITKRLEEDIITSFSIINLTFPSSNSIKYQRLMLTFDPKIF